MNLIICLDPKNGMYFNNRRLSRDIKVCERILALSDGGQLRMNAYSYKLFSHLSEDIFVSEAFLEDAGDGFCFAETQLPDLRHVRRIYVFRWDRIYPSDVCFSPVEEGFTLVSKQELSGNSHEVVTLEVYTR